MYTYFKEKRCFNVHGIKVVVNASENYNFLKQLSVEYGMFEKSDQFLEADIKFFIGTDISDNVKILNTKCGNNISIGDKEIWISGIKIYDPFFYIDDFRPYFTNIIYYKLVLNNNMFMLHSSSYCVNGKGYLMVGESGCGKSSLTLINVLSGGNYLANDITYIGEQDGKINIFGLPQVMNLDDLALRWFGEKMKEEFYQFCRVEKQYEYNKKPKTCVQIKSEKIRILVEKLDYVIFPEQDFNAANPWYEVLDYTCAFPKIISQIKTFDKIGFRVAIDFQLYLRNLEELLNLMKKKVKFISFYWTKDHKRNIEVLRNICAD